MNFLELKCEVRNLKIIGVNDVLNEKGHGCAFFSIYKTEHMCYHDCTKKKQTGGDHPG